MRDQGNEACADCGAPIHFAAKLRDPQWVHDAPLGQLKVSVDEEQSVLYANAEYGHGPDRVYGGRIHAARPLRV